MQATCCIIFGHCVVSNEVIFGDFILFLLTKLEKKYEQVKNSFLHNKLFIGSFAHTLRFLCAYASVFMRIRFGFYAHTFRFLRVKQVIYLVTVTRLVYTSIGIIHFVLFLFYVLSGELNKLC